MIGFPLDSHVTYDTDGTPVYDRAVTSAPLRKLIKKMFSDGVLPNPSTNMRVAAGNGMSVVVYPGFACCNGCMKLEESQRTLAVQASNTNYDRIDTVVLRLNDNDSERICDFYILEGTPATSPVRPTLTRSESVWELGLADLFIAKNSTAVSNQRITDTRYETARCGVMSSISQFDTTTLYQQIQADLEEFQNVSQAEFTEWYESIKGQLSEDAAGNLQNQIGDLQDQIDALPSLVETEVGDWIEIDTSGWVITSPWVLRCAIYNRVTRNVRIILQLTGSGSQTGDQNAITGIQEEYRPANQYHSLASAIGTSTLYYGSDTISYLVNAIVYPSDGALYVNAGYGGNKTIYHTIINLDYIAGM